MHQSPGKCLKIANFLSYKLLTFNCNIVRREKKKYVKGFFLGGGVDLNLQYKLILYIGTPEASCSA